MRVVICSNSADRIEQYRMKAVGAGVMDAPFVAHTGEAVLEELRHPTGPPFDLAVVDLRFSHGDTAEAGLYVMGLLREMQPGCHVICMVESGQMLVQHCDAAIALGVTLFLSFGCANWSCELGMDLIRWARGRRIHRAA